MDLLGVSARALATKEDVPTRWQSVLFEMKAWAFRASRWYEDGLGRPARHVAGASLNNARLLAESTSPLWPDDEAAWDLVAGKIHNLRLAARRLDGIVVPAGEVFSFWRQLGRATRRRGYVPGRELREGCLVPSIGGGLCQLSNALYDAALRAGLQVVERHRHTQVVPGSLAESDRDATVFWNYRDFRLRAAQAWRLEVELDATHLSVRIRGVAADASFPVPIALTARKSVAIEDCAGCGESECHRHVGETRAHAHRTWLVGEDWPEFEAYRKQAFCEGDRVIHPAAAQGFHGRVTSLCARALRRFHLWRGQPLPQARLGAYRWLAQACSRQLRYTDTDLIVPQSLLPYLWAAGELSGRRFDVLMTALPMHEIQGQLDQAAMRHPHSPTLRDFRGDAALVDAEREALARAGHWISPHMGVLELACGRGLPVPWRLPERIDADATDCRDRTDPPRVFLAASALARKGAYELREALQQLPIQLCLPPGAQEAPAFWQGFSVRRAASMTQGIRDADVVVLPAWIEHQPRGLLQAMALGKTVIATGACGLPAGLPWIRVAEGSVAELRNAIVKVLALP
ncbi:MAG: VanW family protein [Pseudoxanthomonas sp.]